MATDFMSQHISTINSTRNVGATNTSKRFSNKVPNKAFKGKHNKDKGKRFGNQSKHRGYDKPKSDRLPKYIWDSLESETKKKFSNNTPGKTGMRGERSP